jgi:hypothetical protein
MAEPDPAGAHLGHAIAPVPRKDRPDGEEAADVSAPAFRCSRPGGLHDRAHLGEGRAGQPLEQARRIAVP